MLRNERLDAVVVSTPTFLHMDIAKLAVQNGVDVFIEKPLSNHLDTAMKLRTLLIMNQRVCMVGYNLRYIPTFKKAKEIIESEQLGALSTVNAYAFISDVLKTEKGWRYNPALSGGGVVIDFTVHMLDMLCWYLGDVNDLTASTRKVFSLDVEDEASISLRFKSGCEAVVESSWSKEEYRKSFFMIEIEGQKGSMKVTDQSIIIRPHGKYQEELY